MYIYDVYTKQFVYKKWSHNFFYHFNTDEINYFVNKMNICMQ